jgi:hypothetical protein
MKRRDEDTFDMFATVPDVGPVAIVAPLTAPAQAPPPPAPAVHRGGKSWIELATRRYDPDEIRAPQPIPVRGDTEAWHDYADGFDTHERYDSPDDYAAMRYQLVYLSGLYDEFLDWTPDDWSRQRTHEKRLWDANPKKLTEYLKKHPEVRRMQGPLTRCAPAWFYHRHAGDRFYDDNVTRWRKLLELPDSDERWNRCDRAELIEKIEYHERLHAEAEDESRRSKATHRGFLAGTLDPTPCIRCGATDGRAVDRPWCLRCDFVLCHTERAPVAPKGYEHPSVPERFSGWDEYQGPGFTDYRVDLHFRCLTCGERCNLHGVCLKCVDLTRVPLTPRTKAGKRAAAPDPVAPAPDDSQVALL